MLSQRQIDVLLRPINGSRILTLDGMSHLAAWDVRAHLNRIFGFANWSADTLDTTLIYDHETTTRAGKPAYRVAYRVTLRLTVYLGDDQFCTYTEGAVGESVMPDFKHGDCHDMAIKTAASQALKRCATNLGDQFGLSLYNQGSRSAVVKGSVAYGDEPPVETPVTTDDHLTGDDDA